MRIQITEITGLKEQMLASGISLWLEKELGVEVHTDSPSMERRLVEAPKPISEPAKTPRVKKAAAKQPAKRVVAENTSFRRSVPAKKAAAPKPLAEAAENDSSEPLSQRDCVRAALKDGPKTSAEVFSAVEVHHPQVQKSTVDTVLGQLKMKGEIEKDEYGMWRAA